MNVQIGWIRAKYDSCVQGSQESVQKYTDRFTALMRQLSISDSDILNISHYMIVFIGE